MPDKAIISDWSGTCFKYPTDEPMNRKIAYSVLADACLLGFLGYGVARKIPIPKPFRYRDLKNLRTAKQELEKRLQEYKEGKRHLWEVYEPFNERVLRGRPISFINSVVDEFAQESRERVDGRVLRPIREMHCKGAYTGILSVSYDYCIGRILKEAGFSDVFDQIVSNKLEVEGDGNMAKGFTLDIYERKPEVLRAEFFEKRGFREHDTYYMGDSEDDKPIAGILPQGHFIVPFLALEDFKQIMAREHSAFVPESEEDLKKYFHSLIS